MASVTITFKRGKLLTPVIRDGDTFVFPFSSVDSSVFGTPQEPAETTEHKMVVFIARSRRRVWRLSDNDSLKVAFELGKNHVKKKVVSSSLSEREEHDVTDKTYSDVCPVDPSRIKAPGERDVQIEVATRLDSKN